MSIDKTVGKGTELEAYTGNNMDLHVFPFVFQLPLY
jgi:hypothetical protein